MNILPCIFPSLIRWFRCSYCILLFTIVLCNSNLFTQSFKWSDSQFWPGGKLPGPMEIVHIGPDQEILLDISPPPLAGIILEGKLTFSNKDLELISGWISIKGGILQIGTSASPFNRQGFITLIEPTQKVSSVQHEFIPKGIIVYEGGQLLLHGAKRETISSSVLATDVFPGDTTLTFNQDIPWREGDRICLAPTGHKEKEAEILTITHISEKEITVNPPISHFHDGSPISLHNKIINTQAEVGLISRSIIIQGDKSSEISHKGAVLKIEGDALTQIEGVEFRFMGQEAEKAKPALEWKGKSFIPGNYFVNNSLHDCFNTGIRLDLKSEVIISNNIFYRVANQGIYLNSNGQLNPSSISNNLIVETYRGKNPKESISSFLLNGLPRECKENHAVGSINGSGFTLSLTQTVNILKILPQFKDNVSHSHFHSEEETEGGTGIHISHSIANQAFNAPIHINYFTSYNNTNVGISAPEMTILLDHVSLINHHKAAELGYTEITHSIIGNVSHTVPTHQHLIPSLGVQLKGGQSLSPQFKLSNVIFSRFSDAGISLESEKFPLFSPINRTIFEDTKSFAFTKGAFAQGILADLDGSITGSPTLLSKASSSKLLDNCDLIPELKMNGCPLNDFVFFQLSVPDHLIWHKANIFISSGVSIKAQTNEHQFSAFIPKNQRITIDFTEQFPEEFEIHIEGDPLSEVLMDIICHPGAKLWLSKGSRVLTQTDDPQKLTSSKSAYYFDKDMDMLHIHTVTGPHFAETIQVHKGNIPYELLSEVAINTSKGKAELAWIPPQSPEVKQFQIMQSRDGEHFTSMAEIGNNDGKKLKYSIDSLPEKEMRYYRIDTWYEDGFIVPSSVVIMEK